MNYWLVKSEPSVYSWEKFMKDKTTVWDGVRNYAARIHLRAMKKGDHVFFYHSNEGLCIAGIAKVVKESYPDPKDKDWVVVDLAPVETLKKPVTLAQIKAEKKLATIPLIRIGRLSVMPVKKEEYDIIIGMSR
ncbi:MAG: EVE domain-containing protein [Bacteroidia bacterium]